jgi:hypothetical protein
LFSGTGGIVLGHRKAVVLAALLVLMLLDVMSLPQGNGGSDATSLEAPTRSIGKVMDLNTTTENPHAEHLIRLARATGKYTDMYQFIDINGDSLEDMVFRQINGTLTSNEDRTHILAVLGPLNENATYDLTALPRWTLPFRVKSLHICDHNGDGMSDLVVSKKQFKSEDIKRNSSFMGFDGKAGSGQIFPWSDVSFTVWLDPKENRTAENVSFQDVDGDGARDLFLQTRTWYRKRPQDFWALPTNEYLIKNGTRALSGRLSRTDVGTELIAERQDSAVYGLYYLDNPLVSGNIKGDDGLELVSFERNFRLSGGGSLRGAVLVVGPLDLSIPRYLVRGNVSTTIMGVVYDGSTTRNSIGVMVRDMDRNGYSDILVTQQSIQANLPNQFILVFKGNRTLPPVWDISLNPPSTTIEGFNPLFLDHDGDGNDDLVVGYYKETVLSRTSCGVLRLALDISKAQFPLATSDLSSVSVMGARTNDEIGRTLLSGDLDGDGRDELLVQTGPQSLYIDLYIIMGLKLHGPKVLGIKGLPDECKRGDQPTIEVFARDPQNYPRYIELSLEIRTGLGSWTIPKVTKTVQNFSYEAPYNGSTFITFTIPPDIGTGSMDIMVTAENTFGLVSEPFVLYGVSTILNFFPYFTDASLSPSELFRSDLLSVQGRVIDPDDQADLKGRMMLSRGSSWEIVGNLTIQDTGQFTGQFIVPPDVNFFTNSVRLEVHDDNGAYNESQKLDFKVLPRRLKTSITLKEGFVLRGDHIPIGVSIDSDMPSTSIELRLQNGTRMLDLMTDLPTGDSIVNMTVPLDMEVGLYSLDMISTDGTWNDECTLDGPVEVRNNPPVIDGALSFVLQGLSGIIDLRDKGSDLEDQGNLTWSLGAPMETGLNAYFRDPSGLLFVDMTDNRTRSLTVTVRDSDGGTASAPLEIGSLWKAPPLAISIKVIGPNDEPLVGANITVSSKGTVISFGSTNMEGTMDLEVPVAGTYSVVVSPPLDSAFIEKVRSGYIPYEGELVIDAQTLLYEVELVHRELAVVRLSTLSVTVKDGQGMPVEGANVTLKGPVNLTLRTDGSGNIIFKDLPSGTYTVQAFMGDRMSLERSLVLSAGQFLSEDLVIEIDRDGPEKDGFPYLELIIGSLLVGLLIGLLFLYLLGTRKKKETSPDREE